MESRPGAWLTAAGRPEEAEISQRLSYLPLLEEQGEKAIYSRQALEWWRAEDGGG